MTVKLHRCPFTSRLINRLPGHACRRVEQALEEAGIEYERVIVKARPQSARTRTFEVSGQYVVPMIEFENGVGYRAESKEMAAEIRAGRLFDHSGARDGDTAEAAAQAGGPDGGGTS